LLGPAMTETMVSFPVSTRLTGIPANVTCAMLLPPPSINEPEMSTADPNCPAIGLTKEIDGAGKY